MAEQRCSAVGTWPFSWFTERSAPARSHAHIQMRGSFLRPGNQQITAVVLIIPHHDQNPQSLPGRRVRRYGNRIRPDRRRHIHRHHRHGESRQSQLRFEHRGSDWRPGAATSPRRFTTLAGAPFFDAAEAAPPTCYCRAGGLKKLLVRPASSSTISTEAPMCRASRRHRCTVSGSSVFTP